MSPFRSFERDVRGEREIAVLRGAGALAVLAGAAWLLVVHPTPRAALFSVLGAIVALAWIARFARGAARAHGRAALHLRPDGLWLMAGEGSTRIPWDDVRSVAVDEERLVVRVERAQGAPVNVEPLWRGVGLHDLGAAIEQARCAARAGTEAPGSGRRTEREGRSPASDTN